MASCCPRCTLRNNPRLRDRARRGRVPVLSGCSKPNELTIELDAFVKGACTCTSTNAYFARLEVNHLHCVYLLLRVGVAWFWRRRFPAQRWTPPVPAQRPQRGSATC